MTTLPGSTFGLKTTESSNGHPVGVEDGVFDSAASYPARGLPVTLRITGPSLTPVGPKGSGPCLRRGPRRWDLVTGATRPRIDATGRPGQVSRRRAPWRRSKLEGKCRAPKIGPRGQTPVRARRAEAWSAAETVWRRWQADSRYYTLILAKRPKSQLFARSPRSLSPPV